MADRFGADQPGNAHSGDAHSGDAHSGGEYPPAEHRPAEHVVSRRRPVARAVRRLPLLVWLVLVWVMLWGTFDVGTVFFGVLVALLVTAVFPAPPIATNIVVRPWRFLQLVGFLAWDMVISTVRVSWQALRHGPGARAGIVAVTLVTNSDHLTAMVANAISLAPGTFVLQVDRVNRICYVYTLGMRQEDAPSVRRGVLAWERRVVHAVGSRAEVTMVDAHVAEERASR
ncbi:Na+/H+ antiporter subunit E [Haloactinomyces albus]|uniref:Multicomponent Na+:H+ antiporter subunit E n=1 Tax=Haloactinomyces albus TaxID=1352928 RepID=A0AAE3ZD65_9ACTN|nr:Na+/H+ antiporter subunit E [Haloactinomyces albus]MDR7301354.1 multicomponent Na+:H+ antiporter subunit E [Haloactinomyces albus]